MVQPGFKFLFRKTLFRVLLILPGIAFAFASLCAQGREKSSPPASASSAPTSDIPGQDPQLKPFWDAWTRQNFQRARFHLNELIYRHPEKLWRVAPEAEHLLRKDYITNEEETLVLKTAEIHQLIRVYDAAIHKDSIGSYSWQIKKGLLMLNHPELFGSELEETLFLCFAGDPAGCPVLLVEALMDHLLENFRGDLISIQKLLSFWVEIERSKLVMEAAGSSPVGASFQDFHKRMKMKIQEILPNCNDIKALFDNEKDSGGNLTLKNWEACLAMIRLGNCWESKFRSEVVEGAVQSQNDPFYLFLGAISSQDSDSQLKLIVSAFDLSVNNALKAQIKVFWAYILEEKKDYTGARQMLEEAATLSPGWGKPNLELADLLIRGSRFCNFSTFELGAIYWAAIDYCQKALNSDDPLVSEEASAKIFEYKSNMPSLEEAAFRGFRLGDTYPIRCWMEIATTVKAP